MPRRPVASRPTLTQTYQRNFDALTKAALDNSRHLAERVRAATESLRPPPGPGDWIAGVALGPAGARGYHLYRPHGMKLIPGEHPPLMVMLHGCGQTGRDLAVSTRMNRLAMRERFLVLYPEQDRLANAQGCWNWFERHLGQADAEAATIMAAIDQVAVLYAIDRDRVAIAGLSAGASMAALLASRYPLRFAAVAMHSGVAPGAATSSGTVLAAMRGEHGPPMPATAVGKAMAAAAVFARLPPLLVLHGDADRTVSPSNAESTAEVWAAATGAGKGRTHVSQRGRRYPMRVTRYRRHGRTTVTLCLIEGLGHAWSGGLRGEAFSDPAGPDATQLIWTFAQRAFRAGEKTR